MRCVIIRFVLSGVSGLLSGIIQASKKVSNEQEETSDGEVGNIDQEVALHDDRSKEEILQQV